MQHRSNLNRPPSVSLQTSHDSVFYDIHPCTDSPTPHQPPVPASRRIERIQISGYAKLVADGYSHRGIHPQFDPFIGRGPCTRSRIGPAKRSDIRRCPLPSSLRDRCIVHLQNHRQANSARHHLPRRSNRRYQNTAHEKSGSRIAPTPYALAQQPCEQITEDRRRHDYPIGCRDISERKNPRRKAGQNFQERCNA